MRTISLLPSLLTLCNFGCGFFSGVFCLQSVYWNGQSLIHNNNVEMLTRSNEYLHYACLIIFLGMIFDMFDGRVARMTNSQCQFGGELDSMADICSFGVAPGIILATTWIKFMPQDAQWWSFAIFCGVVYAACAALRLAMYNLTISETAKDYFSGLPSPAAAGAAVSAILFFSQDYINDAWKNIFNATLLDTPLGVKGSDITKIYILSAYVMVVGLLMVSPFKFGHLANIWFGKGKKFTTLILVVIGLALLVWFPAEMLFLGFNAYLLICLFINIRNRLRHREEDIDKDMEEVLGLETNEECCCAGKATTENNETTN